MTTEEQALPNLVLPMSYCYKGSQNCDLYIYQRDNGTIDFVSQYGELISTACNTVSFMRILGDIEEGKYA